MLQQIENPIFVLVLIFGWRKKNQKSVISHYDKVIRGCSTIGGGVLEGGHVGERLLISPR